MRPPQHKTFAIDSLRHLCKGLPKCSSAKIHQLSLMDTKSIPLQQPIRFILKQPEEGVICPITQEPITVGTSSPSDEAFPIDLDHPDRTAIQLACHHEFSAFWLLFNWVHNKHVKCPLCRAGPSNACLEVSRMPAHIRVSIQRQCRMHMKKSDVHLTEAEATRIFAEAVAGESFLDLFPDLEMSAFFERLNCMSLRYSSTEQPVMCISPSTSRKVLNHFIDWVQCDPVKNTPTWINMSLNRRSANEKIALPIGLVAGLMGHVMNIMYGLSFTTRYDRATRLYYYTVFNPAEAQLRELDRWFPL